MHTVLQSSLINNFLWGFFSSISDQVNGQTTFEKEYIVTPLLANNNKEKYGLALDGRLKDEDTNLASSTM